MGRSAPVGEKGYPMQDAPIQCDGDEQSEHGAVFAFAKNAPGPTKDAKELAGTGFVLSKSGKLSAGSEVGKRRNSSTAEVHLQEPSGETADGMAVGHVMAWPCVRVFFHALPKALT